MELCTEVLSTYLPKCAMTARPVPRPIRALQRRRLRYRIARAGCAALLLYLLPAAQGCRGLPTDTPSVLLFVVDTLRADAVSAYGDQNSPTTPTLDALAAEGVLYANAFSNAPWTLPAHASLFSGLAPHEHNTGWSQTSLPEGIPTLAQVLAARGYQTFAISENPWVSPDFGLDRGFEGFFSSNGQLSSLVNRLSDWLLLGYRPGRPFFIFVNVIDPHWPYTVRERNQYLPDGATDADAREITQWPPDYICARDTKAHDLAIEQGLYLGDVAAADQKLGAVRDLIARLKPPVRLLTVVTSDHGEHFGEHGLAHHQFGLYDELLRVPLVIHGPEPRAPLRIETAVQLADVAGTILTRVGVEVPAGLRGRTLPESDQSPPVQRDIVARYLDPNARGNDDEQMLAVLGRQQTRAMRANCTEDDKVWGDMIALIRHPLKLIRFDRFDDELYDLANDPGERRNLADDFPELFDSMSNALTQRLEGVTGGRPEPGGAAAISPETAARLRALGYLPR